MAGQMRILQFGFLLAGLLLAAPAMAQPASGDGIVDFVDSHSAITRLGKIARWEDGVCPNVTGLPANFVKFITKRVRDVATAAGAPVNASETCKANIDIVFTTKPQGLLDAIRAKDPVMLGYYNSNDQADRMAKVNFVIQAWHATQTVDLRGNALIDSRNAEAGATAQGSRAQNSSGSRLGDGLHSTFYRAIVVANPDKLGDYEIGTLADHVAFVALAQPAAPDACTALPSILDMTKADCRKDQPVKGLTAADTAYLRGLYQADAGNSLRTQKDGIAFLIKDALAGK
jgi:hypothetical protein